MDKQRTSNPIDNSAILFLAQMGPDHTNVYRFTTVLKEPVDPQLLQQAVDRLCLRFPTILAGFRPGAAAYRVVPAEQPPRVQKDPGLLHTMGPEEMADCAYRVYYEGCNLIFEAFHSLTDGYGAVASLRALLGEYLFLRHGLSTPEREEFFQRDPDWEEELEDAYLAHTQEKPQTLPRINAFQLPAENRSSDIHTTLEKVSTQALRDTARRWGVPMTTLLSVLMAEAIMEVQQTHSGGKGEKPVRIMVPLDLRRRFPSKTLRNFVLYTLPTLKPQEAGLPLTQRLQHFQEQIRQQMDSKFLAAQVARNVKLQKNILYRALPLSLKCWLLQLIYRFFGEVNSSITLTNLGPLPMSEEMRSCIRWVELYLTPRRSSPYNCGLLSCGDVTCISISRFGTQETLESLFFGKLRSLMAECE